jgi:hypothetical protein
VTPEQIVAEIKELSDTVSMPLGKDVEVLMEEADYRSGWMARVGEMEADAQRALDVKCGEIADKYSELSATLFREKLKAETADETRLVMLCHRMYSTLSEQIILIQSMMKQLGAQREVAGRFEQGRPRG